jgi:hypothetical protein
MLLRLPTSNQRLKYDFSEAGLWFILCMGWSTYPRGEGRGLSPDWFEGGEGVPTNPPSHLVFRRGQKMQIAPIHHQHAKNRRPWILLPIVSGPWASFVAALDKGRSNIAVCRQYSVFCQIDVQELHLCSSCTVDNLLYILLRRNFFTNK